MTFVLPLSLDAASRLYWELAQRGARSWGEELPWNYDTLSEEELYTLALLQSRYDPRLLEVLVDFFRQPRALDPVRFKESLRRHAALPIAAVIGEFILQLSSDASVTDFSHFLQAGVRPVPTQLFYLCLYRIGGRKMDESRSQPLWPFKKWGFLAADPPFEKGESRAERPYLYDAVSRRRILEEMARGQNNFRMRDYLTAVHHSVSRQQARLDIAGVAWIGQRGSGKGTRYKIKRPSSH